ncbi:MAG TPA: pyruvate ferredoxin oxidoreductase [Caldithrix abyssi]|uniref:Pyruvate ferredoxin oxidoreductase n=1 Tax=Caldithrix abyssi TaxID=187145 RepID=A0A7V5UF48_CALAY|nr:pyruvate ferredoxin oxidoreductase [Caldithrix abyssi]
MLKYFDPETISEIKVIEGTHAASYAVKLARVKVISAYPITPQTSIVEKLSEMCASGEIDAEFIKVESEHSAMAAVIGSQVSGARSFTATSSQGLALMHEVLHWAAGSRLPIVLANVNRALGPPWNIWADQTDSLAQRDTGWIQFYCESNQEVLDMVIQAFRLGEQVMLPVMVNMDAFFLSHTSEPVALPKQELVDQFLPPYQPKFKLDLNDPHAFGGLAMPNSYMEFRYNIQESMEEAARLIPIIAEEYAQLTGRHHGTLIEQYRTTNADYLLITAGTMAGTARLIVDEFREKGVKLGLIKIRAFRPFPFAEIRAAVKDVAKVGVIDRNFSFGKTGIFFDEIKGALYNAEHRPLMNGYVAGLGGRDVTPKQIREIAEHLIKSEQGQDLIWIGVKK